MSLQNEIQLVELQVNEAKEMVELGKAIDRLTKNRDFKKVIEKAFFEQEAIRTVFMRSNPAFQSPEHQASITNTQIAIGELRNFLNAKGMLADQAAASLAEYEEVLDELRDEEAGE